MLMKKIPAVLVVCAALLCGAAGAGTASAAVPNPRAVTATAKHSHHLGRWLAGHRRQVRRAVVSISAKTIGVTRHELVTELRTGKSLSEIAGEHSVSAQTVADALLNAADAHVTKAVANHKLTPTEAAKVEARLQTYVGTLVNHSFGGKAVRKPSPTVA
jgi:hypothetical protein